MAAEHDSKQGHTFVYSNFYEIYRHAKMRKESEELAKGAVKGAPGDAVKGVVLKHGPSPSSEMPTPASIRIVGPQESKDFKRWTERSEAGRNLVHELRSLRDSKKRLDFLMEELNTLMKF